MEIAYVFTNYNNSEYSVACVQSIVRADSFSQIVIVDNYSSDREIVVLRELEKEVNRLTVIYNDTNVGYFAGLNIGIEYLRNKFPDIKHFVVGNNDLVFDKKFCDSLRSNVFLFEKYPVLSPDIVTLDGFHQNPHVVRGVSRFREFVYDLYHLNYFLALTIKFIAGLTKSFTDRRDELQYQTSQEVNQGYGACYILGPLFFKYFDHLWSPTFIMHEEFFLSKQLEEKGFKVYYEPSMGVKHHWNATMASIPSKRKWEYAREAHRLSRSYYKNK